MRRGSRGGKNLQSCCTSQGIYELCGVGWAPAPSPLDPHPKEPGDEALIRCGSRNFPGVIQPRLCLWLGIRAPCRDPGATLNPLPADIPGLNRDQGDFFPLFQINCSVCWSTVGGGKAQHGKNEAG